MKKLAKITIIWVQIIISSMSIAGGPGIDPADFTIIGRGEVLWYSESVIIKDCILRSKDTIRGAFEFSFEARALPDENQVQIWSGIGMVNRDNRYMLGLRGGNNDDLFLRRRKTLGKEKLLALHPLNFQPQINDWYKMRMVKLKEKILIFIGDESLPRIVAIDDDPLVEGSAYIGGGWIRTEYRNLQVKHLSDDDVDTFEKMEIAKERGEKREKRSVKREAARKENRLTYKSVWVKQLSVGRTEVELNGPWLFMPESGVNYNEAYNPDKEDEMWHLMPVPQFWNPVSNWMYGWEKGLDSPTSGVSDNYGEKELERCNAYTFDWKNTHAAWYRQWIILPDDLKGKIFKLHFDAVSKVAEVYVNGHYAGGHVGMFADFDLDITSFVKPGKNLIAVNVKVRKFEADSDANQTVARAVTVDITNDMLNSLPHGMFQGTEGGIWQPAKLCCYQSRIYPEYICEYQNGWGRI